jgi:hypothetical protein
VNCLACAPFGPTSCGSRGRSFGISQGKSSYNFRKAEEEVHGKICAASCRTKGKAMNDNCSICCGIGWGVRAPSQ